MAHNAPTSQPDSGGNREAGVLDCRVCGTTWMECPDNIGCCVGCHHCNGCMEHEHDPSKIGSGAL